MALTIKHTAYGTKKIEATYFTETFASIADGETPKPVIMNHLSSSGKTCIAKYIGDQLRQEVLDAEFQPV